MRARARNPDDLIATLAGSNHGVVTIGQLRAAGITRSEVRHRAAGGSLRRQHRGVYRVGHEAPSVRANYLAAVWACGETALLSGRAAAYLHGLIAGRPPVASVSTATDRRVSGVRTRRVRAGIHPDDAAVRDGIPVTTLARTLVDLAGELQPDVLAAAFHEASVKYRLRPEAVEDVLVRRPRARGAGVLRRVLRGDQKVTLSGLERRFLKLLGDRGLPLPKTNQIAGGRRVDCRWPDRRLTVELDGYRYHGSRHAWEKDRRREREARARGDEFRRYTYGDVYEHSGLMLTELDALLGAPS